MGNLAASPCCLPDWDAEPLLEVYGAMGFTAFEVFTEWAQSRFDVTRAPEDYLVWGRQYGLRFTSMHLPTVQQADEASLDTMVKSARFARAIGVEVVLFKAQTREIYIEMARPFLDAIAGFGLIPVLQNHAGSALSTLDDVRYVLDGIDDDRMKALLEVGHFHIVGVSWREAAEYLGDRIALVHIKDQVGPQSVPYGTGEIDLPGLFTHMADRGYTGRYVVEMEVKDHENTLRYLEEALDWLEKRCVGARR